VPASDVGQERRAHQRQVRRCEVALALVREQTLFVENSLLDRQSMQFVTDCRSGVVELPLLDDQASSGVDDRL